MHVRRRFAREALTRWLVGAGGGVFALGGAPYFGSMGGTPLDAPIVAATT